MKIAAKELGCESGALLTRREYGRDIDLESLQQL